MFCLFVLWAADECFISLQSYMLLTKDKLGDIKKTNKKKPRVVSHMQHKYAGLRCGRGCSVDSISFGDLLA